MRAKVKPGRSARTFSERQERRSGKLFRRLPAGFQASCSGHLHGQRIGRGQGDTAAPADWIRPKIGVAMATQEVKAKGAGTRADPWVLKTPPGSSEYLAFRDDTLDPPALVVIVGKTELRYRLRCLDDLHAKLKERGDWMPLGSADEQKPAADGSVEAWARSDSNPVGGWYGLKKGLRGRFANYVPPVMEALGLAEVEHEARNNRMRAL